MRGHSRSRKPRRPSDTSEPVRSGEVALRTQPGPTRLAPGATVASGAAVSPRDPRDDQRQAWDVRTAGSTTPDVDFPRSAVSAPWEPRPCLEVVRETLG